MEQCKPEAVCVDEIEVDEKIAVLRNNLDQLPDLERTLLACSYCTNMSQQEIAKLVGISQQTVSNKIQHALERLRLNMSGAGMAAVVPLLGRENLFEAMSSGYNCPPGMTDRIMERIAARGRVTRAVSSRYPASIQGTVWPYLAAVVVAATVVFGMVASNRMFPAARSQSAVKQAVPETVAKKADVNRRWTFEKGPADDLKVIGRGWNWQPLPEGSGEMVAPTDANILVVMPISVTAEPLVISVEGTFNKPGANEPANGEGGMGAIWLNDDHVVPFRRWIKNLEFNKDLLRVNYTVYVFDRYVVMLNGNELNTIAWYSTEYPSKVLGLFFRKIHIQKIDVKSLKPDRLPEFVHDMPQTIERIGSESSQVDETGKETRVGFGSTN